MARSDRSEVRPPERDPAYAGRRDNDRRSYYGWSFVENLAWPVAAIAIAFLGAITAVYVLHGQERVVAFVEFLQGPAVIGLIGAVLAAAVKVVASVPHTARLERRQAATQAGVEEATQAATASASRVDTIARFAERLDSKVDRLDVKVDALAAGGAGQRGADPGAAELKALVGQLAARLERIEVNALAAVRASTGAQAALSGYGASLATIARGVTGLTGPTPAQAPRSPLDGPQERLWTPGGTDAHPDSPERPQAPTGLPDSAEYWSRRPGSHRALTAQQPAVPAGPPDEHEDWQETDEDDEQDDGPGLDTSLIRGFRARMAREDELERAAREARQEAQAPPPAPPTAQPSPPTVQGPRPMWTPASVSEDELPPHIRAARDRAVQQKARERAEYWSNPEEGPQ